MHLVATKPTPILNTPDFAKVFGGETLPLDEQGLLRPVEMVALPGTKFRVVQFLPQHICQVSTRDYPGGPYYIDSRFCSQVEGEVPDREKVLPTSEKILSQLEGAVGLPYIWGGNWGRGIPEISQLYRKKIPEDLKASWILEGVDCSGLLYEATGGFTPRNTSDLLHFGKQITTFEDVKPLDILVWPGHVLIFLTKDLFIESLLGKGVITTPFVSRWKEIKKHSPVIRRFTELTTQEPIKL